MPVNVQPNITGEIGEATKIFQYLTFINTWDFLVPGFFVIFNYTNLNKPIMTELDDFQCNACEVRPNADDMTCMVYVDIDGWDRAKEAYQDIEYFAEGENDPMGEEIEETLYEMGYELVYPGTLVDDETIEFKLKKI